MAILLNDLDTLAYWSHTTLAFLGCFRTGELVTIPNLSGYSAPQVQDLSVGTSNGRPYLQLIVKHSKTKPYGFTTLVGCTCYQLCATYIAVKYLRTKGIHNTWVNPQILFLLSNGLPITKEMFVNKLKNCLSFTGINPSNFSRHSLGIGCAILVGQSGFFNVCLCGMNVYMYICITKCNFNLHVLM